MDFFHKMDHMSMRIDYQYDSFGVIFNSPSPEEFSHQTDPSGEFINKPLEPSMKGKIGTNPEIKYSCYELLQLDSIGGKSGDDLVPYHNFKKLLRKSDFDLTMLKIQIDSDIEAGI